MIEVKTENADSFIKSIIRADATPEHMEALEKMNRSKDMEYCLETDLAPNTINLLGFKKGRVKVSVLYSYNTGCLIYTRFATKNVINKYKYQLNPFDITLQVMLSILEVEDHLEEIMKDNSGLRGAKQLISDCICCTDTSEMPWVGALELYDPSNDDEFFLKLKYEDGNTKSVKVTIEEVPDLPSIIGGETCQSSKQD